MTATLQLTNKYSIMKTKAEAGTFLGLERVAGIEPAYCAWEAHVLPLNYTRIDNGGIIRHAEKPCQVLTKTLPFKLIIVCVSGACLPARGSLLQLLPADQLAVNSQVLFASILQTFFPRMLFRLLFLTMLLLLQLHSA